MNNHILLGTIKNTPCLLMSNDNRRGAHKCDNNLRTLTHQLKKKQQQLTICGEIKCLSRSHALHLLHANGMLTILCGHLVCLRLMRQLPSQIMCVCDARRSTESEGVRVRCAPRLKAYSRITTQLNDECMQADRLAVSHRKASGEWGGKNKRPTKNLYCNSLPFALLQLRMPADSH